MLDWKDCIVSLRPEVPKNGCVWVAYQPVKPFLPVAIADSASELAMIVGVPIQKLMYTNSRAKRRIKDGKSCNAQFRCVYIGDV